MADYYTSYSAETKGLTDEESKWVHSRIKEIEDAGDEDAVCGLGEVEVADGALWFHGEEHGDPRAVAEFARDFLKRFRPRDGFAPEYAHTCSRPRMDGFGGGAFFVTADHLGSLGRSPGACVRPSDAAYCGARQGRARAVPHQARTHRPAEDQRRGAWGGATAGGGPPHRSPRPALGRGDAACSGDSRRACPARVAQSVPPAFASARGTGL
jgi:hypothetical protein